MSEPSFRLAAESDAPAVLSFMREYYAFDGHAFDEEKAGAALKTLLRDRGLGRAWLILDGATAVGYIVLCFGYSLEWLGRDAFVDEFYLREDHRRLGWGSATMAYVEKELRALDITTLHLEVVERNDRALQIYRKLGFKEHKSKFLSKWIAKDFSKPEHKSCS